MRALRIIVLLVLLAVTLCVAWMWLAMEAYYKGYEGDVFVEVRPGMGTRSIARLLEGKGVVRSSVAFEVYARWLKGHSLQAGEYYFRRPMPGRAVFQTIADGQVYDHSVTLPEGLNMFQIADRLEQEGFVTREEFLSAARNPAAVRDLAPHAETLEGFLFPDTYRFPRHTSGTKIVGAMVGRFRKEWSLILHLGGNPDVRSVLEVVTLASLVERETAVFDERELIAGVYSNRLRRGVALQCDPTVLYAMQLANKNDGVIHQSDLRMNSPYNTYRYRGLPPGPIANPGAVSLLAALAPPKVDYFYFVANLEGGHSFSRTLAEHNSKVAQYRRKLRQAVNGNDKRRP